MILSTERYLESLRADGAALARAAADAMDAAVPACPGWDVAELVWHTAEVHYFWGEIAGRRLQDPKEVVELERPADDKLLELYLGNLERLVAVLEEASPSAAVWTWSSQKDIAFIQRRMAQETAVHRWDAQSAAGAPGPLATHIAGDGIDEFLQFMLSEKECDGVGESVHLHATDGDGEWIIRTGGGLLKWDRAHEKGDAAVRAAASDLLLLLWRRVDAGEVDVIGDRAALDRFLARADLT